MIDGGHEQASRHLERMILLRSVKPKVELSGQPESCDRKWRQHESATAVGRLSALESFGTRGASLESALVEHGNSRSREIQTLDGDTARLGQQIRQPELDPVRGLERQRLHVARRR